MKTVLTFWHTSASFADSVSGLLHPGCYVVSQTSIGLCRVGLCERLLTYGVSVMGSRLKVQRAGGRYMI